MTTNVHLSSIQLMLALFILAISSSCGGGSSADLQPRFTVSGTVGGLNGTLVIQDNGTDDLTLSGSGPFTFTTPLADGAAYDVTVLSLPAGQYCSRNNSSGTIRGNDVTDVSIVCATSSIGVLDDAFGSSAGIIRTRIGSSASAQAIAIQPDGRIWAAGESDGAFALARYHADGSREASFGTKGVARTPMAITAGGFAFQPDGKTVVVGSSESKCAATRYNADGSLDTGFGASGTVMTSIAVNAVANGVAIQADGKIVAVGAQDWGWFAGPEFFVLRYNPDGSLDSSFGSGGIVLGNIGGVSGARAVAIQPDGMIVAAGSTSYAWRDSSGVTHHRHEIALARYSASGALDAGFGSGGVVRAEIGDAASEAYAVTIQGNGKILVAGRYVLGTESHANSYLARFNSNGVLDSTFSPAGAFGGIVRMATASTNNSFNAIAVQADGQILASGHYWDGATPHAVLARFASNSLLDTSFGGNGIVESACGYQVALQTDGKILVGGSSSAFLALERYLANGALDTGFGSRGVAKTDLGTFDDTAYAMALQVDGKILAAGSFSDGSRTGFAMTRYEASGILDASFGSGGIARGPIGSSNDSIRAVLLQPDGRVVAVGASERGAAGDFVLARYNVDGTPDTTFGAGALVRYTIGLQSSAYAGVLQPDGKIVAVGHSYDGSSTAFTLIRCHPDGTLDTRFGTGGIARTVIATGAVAHAVALLPDGKLVVAGQALEGSITDFTLARYDSDGALDTTFGTGGLARNLIGHRSYASALAIQPDGKIVAAGYSLDGSGDFALVRCNADGTLDPGFGTGGIAEHLTGSTASARALALQADGKIVVAGSSSSDVAIVRCRSDGTMDASFGIGGVARNLMASPSIAYAVSVQTDGKIVAVGGTSNGTEDFAVLRLE